MTSISLAVTVTILAFVAGCILGWIAGSCYPKKEQQ